MKKVQKLVFVLISMLSFLICFVYANNKESLEIDRVSNSHTLQLTFDKKLDNQNFAHYAAKMSRHFHANIYRRAYQQNGNLIFYGVFDPTAVNHYKEKFFQADRQHWFLNQQFKIKALASSDHRSGTYLIQLRDIKNHQQVLNLKANLAKYFGHDSFTLTKNPSVADDFSLLNDLTILLFMALLAIVLLIWFDYLFSLRARSLKVLFGYSKMTIFCDLLADFCQPLLYGSVSIVFVAVASLIKLGNFIYPIFAIMFIAIGLLFLTSCLAALIFLSLLSFSHFRISNIKGYSYEHFLYKQALLVNVLWLFFY